jgi:hypothetical protein
MLADAAVVVMHALGMVSSRGDGSSVRHDYRL